MIYRSLHFILRHHLGEERVKPIFVIGQRQTGKTCLLKMLQEESKIETQFVDFEDLNNQLLWEPKLSRLKKLLGGMPKLLLLDEVQYLAKAGSILKLIYDHFPTVKVVATGSASFLLLKSIGDSLYGRHRLFHLYPFSVREILGQAEQRRALAPGEAWYAEQPNITEFLHEGLIYGSLPEVYSTCDHAEKRILLQSYLNSLLFKDIFEIEGIRHPQVFKRLLKLLALQIGSEVNPNELAKTLEINRKTVLEYIHLYEKFCIVHTLLAWSTNPRKEISKGFKVYFSDLGVRNALIDNFSATDNRTDVGYLFENLVFNTFKQQVEYAKLPYQFYFWRSYAQAEVDILLHHIERDRLLAFEIKWTQSKKAPPKGFQELYRGKLDAFYGIHQDNFWQFC